MDITTVTRSGFIELQVHGSLDNQSAPYFRETVDATIRQGSDRILVDLSQVGFMSSAGISALLTSQRELQAIEGHFGVSAMSSAVESLLRHMKLFDMLSCDAETLAGLEVDGDLTRQTRVRVAGRDGMALEEYLIQPGAAFDCQLLGDAERLATAGYSETDSQSIEFPPGTLGLGLGALGSSFEECRERYGDFLSVAGTAAVASPSSVSGADYLTCSEHFTPAMEVLYGVQCRGEFSHLLRFQSVDEEHSVRFANLVEVCHEVVGTPQIAVVVVAECAGLVGATMRKVPLSGPAGGTDRFAHPEIRNWLAFSGEQTHRRSLVLIAGIALGPEGADARKLNAFVRPMGSQHRLRGHFHAAAFPYQPLKKRTLDLQQTVQSLFASEGLRGVIHLLNDERPVTGAGDSELLNGACWVSPIEHFEGF